MYRTAIRALLIGHCWHGCAAVAADAGRPMIVAIENMRSVPQTVTVHRGDRVTWSNHDLFPHTATGATFDSHPIASGASWTWDAKTPGRYVYECSLHPGMTAVVIVE